MNGLSVWDDRWLLEKEKKGRTILWIGKLIKRTSTDAWYFFAEWRHICYLFSRHGNLAKTHSLLIWCIIISCLIQVWLIDFLWRIWFSCCGCCCCFRCHWSDLWFRLNLEIKSIQIRMESSKWYLLIIDLICCVIGCEELVAEVESGVDCHFFFPDVQLKNSNQLFIKQNKRIIVRLYNFWWVEGF